MALTFYCALMAIALFYLGASFASELPWVYCDPEWAGDNCVDSINRTVDNNTKAFTSVELYFRNFVLNEVPNIEGGIGMPHWRLTICLFFSWITIFVAIVRGVKSSGKAAYFLAMFPYVVLVTLLIRGATLPGAKDGVLYFLTPQLERLKDPEVWYDAVTQAFFSLTVCFGTTTAYSSFNDFRNNIHRDTLIVTSLDTLTSLLAGCTTFAILGNLAHEQGEDVRNVVTVGTGLAFISYPSAIAKFNVARQVFSVLFFIMLYALGVGSAVALVGLVITAIRDQWPHLPYWPVALATCCVGFLVGLIYVTPGGQYILTLIDGYSVTFTLFVLGCVQMAAVAWIYGVENFCQDLEFMLGRKTTLYWRLCWCFFTPALLLVILLYALNNVQPLQYNNVNLPSEAYVAGWVLFALGVIAVPIGIVYQFIKNRHLPLNKIMAVSFCPNAQWGPSNPEVRKEWQQFKETRRQNMDRLSVWRRVQLNMFGSRRNDLDHTENATPAFECHHRPEI
ncbi:sodium-dependent nutrient amino acid transporter 1 isoform X2 [Anabrus simplex]